MSQVARFVLIGGACALIDSGVYGLLLQAGLWVHAAKATSFIAGTTIAYLLNRRFTFTTARRGSAGQISGFAALYLVTFFVNVAVNALALHLLPDSRWTIALAWIIAQAMATTINFVMLRWVIFREPAAQTE